LSKCWIGALFPPLGTVTHLHQKLKKLEMYGWHKRDL
jgi:hypothetical protein